MNKQNITNVIQWILGVFFSIIALAMFGQGIISGLFFSLIPMVLLPPVNKFLNEKLKFELKANLKSVIIFLAFVLSMSFADNSNNLNSNNEVNYKNSAPEIINEANKESTTIDNNNELANIENKLYKVVKVIDGDTADLMVNGQIVKIRMIGLNTPEVEQCYFNESKNRASELLFEKEVKIEFDESQGFEDKYNRTLAYIILPDGSYFEEKMIKEGYSKEYTYNKPYDRINEHKKAEEFARNNKLGLWSDICSNKTTINNQVDEQNTTIKNIQNNEAQIVPVVPIVPVAEVKTVAPAEVPVEAPVIKNEPIKQTINCNSNSYNCNNFTSQKEAQNVYEYCLKINGNDIHGLDGSDNDGLVCESLK